LVFISAIASLAALAEQSGGGKTQAAATQTVVIKGMKYQPAEITVHVGDTVEWKNQDIVAHTVTARDKSFDSGKIAPGS
jgi:plastocyanin